MTIDNIEWAVLGYSLVCAVLAGLMAGRKSRHVGLWAVFGFCLGILALIILGFLDNAGIRWSVRK
jgi:hypothetical protein